MGISTKGVFHYTKNIDNIIRIISEGFLQYIIVPDKKSL